MKKICVLLNLCVPIMGFAAAGFADRRIDLLDWLGPSIKMISISTACFFILLFLLSYFYKYRISIIFGKIIEYLRRKRFLATLITGCFTSTILAFITFFLDMIFWFLALLPVLFILTVYPIVLGSRLRNKWLLNKKVLWLQSITFISLVFSVIIFIACVELNILSVPAPFYVGVNRFNSTPFLDYPLDALSHIFEGIIYYGMDVLLSLFFVGLGNILRSLQNNLSHKHGSYSI